MPKVANQSNLMPLLLKIVTELVRSVGAEPVNSNPVPTVWNTNFPFGARLILKPKLEVISGKFALSALSEAQVGLPYTRSGSTSGPVGLLSWANATKGTSMATRARIKARYRGKRVCFIVAYLHKDKCGGDCCRPSTWGATSRGSKAGNAWWSAGTCGSHGFRCTFRCRSRNRS